MVIHELTELMNDAELQLIIFNRDKELLQLADELYVLIQREATTYNIEVLDEFVQSHKRYEG